MERTTSTEPSLPNCNWVGGDASIQVGTRSRMSLDMSSLLNTKPPLLKKVGVLLHFCDLAEKPPMVNRNAAVHDNLHAVFLGQPRSFFADHTQLQPECLCFHRYRFADNCGHRFRPAKDVHNVDGFRDILEIRIACLIQHCLVVRIHGKHAISATHEVSHDVVAVPPGLVCGADDGNRAGGSKNPAD